MPSIPAAYNQPVEEGLQAFLRDAELRERPDLVQLSIRKLLERWGHKRRGYWIVSKIEQDLDDVSLTTEPSFTQGWIDTTVTLLPKRLIPVAGSEPVEGIESVADGEAEPGEVTLLVSSLRSAGNGICSVVPDASIVEAQTLMMKNDFSQLAVVSGPRSLRGALTWESIAQASLHSARPSVMECVVPAEVVRFEDDLMHHIPRIVDAGYVFVQGRDQSIEGIVTTSDLSDEFARLATPFFLVGEVERRLRRVVRRTFTTSQIASVRDTDDTNREVTSVDDLTMGEYARLLESRQNWEKTGWQIDRKIFIGALHDVREIRNDVMHFSPDPLDQEQLNQLRLFVRFLKILDP